MRQAKERKGEREGVEGKRKGRERRDEWRATRAACSTALVGLLLAFPCEEAYEEEGKANVASRPRSPATINLFRCRPTIEWLLAARVLDRNRPGARHVQCVQHMVPYPFPFPATFVEASGYIQ